MNTCTCIICIEIDINSLGTGIFLIWCEHSELFIVLKQCETSHFEQTTTELDNTKERQEKTKAKSSEAEKKAQTERGHIKKELDTVRDALTAIR